VSTVGTEFTISAPHELGVVLASVLPAGQVSVPVDANGFGLVPGVAVTITEAGLYRVEGGATLQTQNGVDTTLDAGFSLTNDPLTRSWPTTYPMTGSTTVALSGASAVSSALSWLEVDTAPASVFLWVHVAPADASFTIQGGPASRALSSPFGKALTWLTAELVEGPPI
jgi:hypothetical protein